ncbi:hypothetical protein LJR153_007329 [Paenibacillus sp. LjRoot153]|uniref:hypothetical protein n=1 Tax=Paenibacillus sp. LjRoot153 TaxID=3342270 RepID=UPI003ECC73C5
MVDPNVLIFSDSGEVSFGIPHDREVIYIGRNGNRVERIKVHLNNNITNSYIYKPLTNFPSMGKEVWVQENICSRIPEVRIPRIHYYSKTTDPENYWMVLEDLGKLEHKFDVDTMKKAAVCMPYWHVLPIDLVLDEYEGHSPLEQDIRKFLLSKVDQLRGILVGNGYSNEDIDYMYREIIQLHLESEVVVSHGDLYPLNIAELNNELIILDWEYIHKNSAFWDLYTLMDITSPEYRRPAINQISRIDILTKYVNVRNNLESPTKHTFIDDYHRFSAMHALWLLLLIDSDLTQEKYDKVALLLQYKETLAILKIVLDYLLKQENITQIS